MFKPGNRVTSIQDRKDLVDSLVTSFRKNITDSDALKDIKKLEQQKNNVYIVVKRPNIFGTFQAELEGTVYKKLKAKDFQLATTEQINRYELQRVFNEK